MLSKKISERGTPDAAMPMPTSTWSWYEFAASMRRPPRDSHVETAACVHAPHPADVLQHSGYPPLPDAGLFESGGERGMSWRRAGRELEASWA